MVQGVERDGIIGVTISVSYGSTDLDFCSRIRRVSVDFDGHAPLRGGVATSLEKPLGHEYVEGPTVEVASRRLSPSRVFSGK